MIVDSNYGVIEGYFGTPWSMDERLSYPKFLAEYGYNFFIYAPKNDPFLRKSWDKPWTQEYSENIRRLKVAFNNFNIDFGVGFTPAGVASDVCDHPDILISRIKEIAEILQPDYFVLLFDDLKNSDEEKLAYYQLKITDIVLNNIGNLKKFILCPSYYSFDPILPKVFGEMPKNYWQEYAQGLDPKVDIFWTGEKVCSTGYSREHLLQVTDIFKRKVFLWDNYPVNDGKKMADFLYLEPFSNRTSDIAELTSGHAINPMREPFLNKLVLATLPYAYKGNPLTLESSEYWNLATKILGNETAELIKNDCYTFAKCGRSSINDGELLRLKALYSSVGSDASNEIYRYLAGEYAFDPACLT